MKHINPWGLASFSLCMIGLVLVSITSSWMVALGVFVMLIANNMAHSIKLAKDK